ncbi:MAG: radical SAM protein [Desulfobacteraceae bacterium]|nr:radical SAM protein [Desulfobacterales bacterium]MBL6966916.1 radical SAM protein [Desulfobacteraceae bacterium]
MNKRDLNKLPFMLYADSDGRVYEHPHLKMLGFSGSVPVFVEEDDLIQMPEFSKLFYLPESPPIGLDPDTGEAEVVTEMEVDGAKFRCFAVSAFLEPGWVRSHLPAADYRRKSFILPSWAYGAVGFRAGGYWASGFRIEYNHTWDPKNFDDRELTSAIREFKRGQPKGPLVRHLIRCARENHCFAAKNLFLKRWEAPLPVSRRCNASCLGCLSLQPGPSFEASHERISFTPSKNEIVLLAVEHLNSAPEPIVSFGQGCEGEPLTEYRLISESIREIRRQTGRGTINLNTNGSWPERVREVAQSGLDSIRISINSARPELYRAYYRPRDYNFDDVVESIALSKEMGLYTMINYLIFPGITDQTDEIDALRALIIKTGVNFLHLKNLCIDPALYLEKMPAPEGSGIGVRQMVKILREEFPDLELGYFNQPATRIDD